VTRTASRSGAAARAGEIVGCEVGEPRHVGGGEIVGRREIDAAQICAGEIAERHRQIDDRQIPHGEIGGVR